MKTFCIDHPPSPAGSTGTGKSAGATGKTTLWIFPEVLRDDRTGSGSEKGGNSIKRLLFCFRRPNFSPSRHAFLFIHVNPTDRYQRSQLILTEIAKVETSYPRK